MRAEEADAIFCDLGQFEQRDHLEAEHAVSAVVLEQEWYTNPPLSVRML